MRFVLGVAALVPGAAQAGTFFTRGDPGPVISRVRKILSDSTRTIAWEETGTFLRTGDLWTPFPTWAGDPRLSYLPQSEDVFSAGGALYGLTPSSPGKTLLSRLGNDGAWKVLAELDAAVGRPGESASRTRLYGFLGGRFVSASLDDGAIRQEPSLPAQGRVYVVADTPLLLGTSSAAEKPVYRLDGSNWIPLSAWAATALHVSSSGGALFSIESETEVRRLSVDGTSQALAGVFPGASRSDPGCSACDDVSFQEWQGQTLTVARTLSSHGLFRLSGTTFVDFSPAPPYPLIRAVYPQGDRLYAAAFDDSLYSFDGTRWSEVPSPGGRPGADRYFQGAVRLYGASGGIWQRVTSGWMKLPGPPGLPVGSFEVLYGDRPVAQADVSGRTHLFAFSESSGSWDDLLLPEDLSTQAQGSMLPLYGAGGSLFAITSSGAVARLDGGGWKVLGPDSPGTAATVVEAAGVVYVLGFSKAYRVEADSLVPAFGELGNGFLIRDVLALRETTYLAVTGAPTDFESARPSLLAVSGGTVKPILDERDGFDPFDRLARVGDEILVGRAFPGRFRALGRNGLREARAETRFLEGIDRTGRFAWGRNDGGAGLLVPSSRVRKTLPVFVDTIGLGGVRYRSSVLVASFSDLPTTVRLATSGRAAVEIPLSPHEERWIEGLFPGTVGTVSLEFDGIGRDEEAFALVRVSNPSDGGTSGTSLPAVDSGSFTGQGVLLPPAQTPGSRFHLALANAGDGARTPLRAFARPPESGIPTWETGDLAPGQFLQLDLLPPATGATRLEGDGFPRTDDLVGYCVRNDGTTNDGTVVPFEPPDPLPQRKARFLPAVVSLTSPFARYRTELSLARRRYLLTDDEARVRTFHVTYTSAASSPRPVRGTFDLGLTLADVVRVSDVGPWLSSHGIDVDPGSVDGSLRFTCDEDVGAADLVVTAVVLAQPGNGSGEYGVSVPVLNEGGWASSIAVVPGLVEDAASRSNLAVANAEGEEGRYVTLTVTIRRGRDGAPIGTLPPVTLKAGERYQFNRPLRTIGFGDGVAFAVVERTGGTGRFVAYGVLNDAVTSDGTLLPMARPFD